MREDGGREGRSEVSMKHNYSIDVRVLPNSSNPRITPSPILKKKKGKKEHISRKVSTIRAWVHQNTVRKSYCWQGRKAKST